MSAPTSHSGGRRRSRIIRITIAGTAAIGLTLIGIHPASAHSGLTAGDSVWSAWSVDPFAALYVLLAVFYTIGLRRWRNPSHPINRWQRASFYAGTTAMVAALISPVDALADHLFLWHQIQHILLRMVGPPLIMLGAPLTPVLRGLPVEFRQNVVRSVAGNPRARAIYKNLNHPLLVAVTFMALLYFWQIPALHDLSVRNVWVHYGMHASMVISGMLFWWMIIDPKPHRSRIPYGARLLTLGLMILPNTFLGALITFSDDVLYSAYGDTESIWDISSVSDQRFGGLLMWLPVDMMFVLAGVFVFSRWYASQSGPTRLVHPRTDL